MSDSKTIKKEEVLKLVQKPLAMSVDGHTITLRENGMAEVIFFQIDSKESNVIVARGVSSLRMTIDQVRALRDVIGQLLKQHDVKMAKKGK